MPGLRPKLLAAALVALSAAGAGAQSVSCSTQTIGRSTYTSCSDGYQRSTQQVGRFTYGSDNRGTSSTTQRIGNSQYYSDSRGTSATSQRIGSFEYTSIYGREGSGSVTTQRIGSFDYSNGTLPGQQRVTGSSQQIGSMRYGSYQVTPPPGRIPPY
jgi:hypothetical protein